MNVPDFIIIGAPKGGTTSLYHYLRQHPQIYMSVLKDSHFFLHDGATPCMGGPSDKDRNREMIKTWSAYQKQFQAAGPDQVCGEIGVRYLDSPAACQAIRRRLPEVKLIVILRQPVERAYSHYRMYRRNGSELCETFEQALADEPRRLQEGWFRALHQHLGYYHQHLKPYFENFSREQIRVFLFDELKADPAGLMRDLFVFLGVDPEFRPDMMTRFNRAGEIANPMLRWAWSASRGLRSRATPMVPVQMRGRLVSWMASRPVKPHAAPPLAEQTQRALLEAYREDIQRLSELLGRDLSHWLNPVDPS